MIKKIQVIDKETYVYDLMLDSNHNFVANGIVVHNSGRPAYDEHGESVLIARTEEEARELVDHFIMGQPEDIQSKLAVEPILRMHTLALIASNFCTSEDSLKKFFSKTFYAFQFGDTSVLEEKIFQILEQLIEWKFVVSKKNKIEATRIGKRVSELYIDPLTAHQFIQALDKTKQKKIHPFGLLQLISNTIEMRPLLSVRAGEFSELEDVFAKREEELLQEIPDESELEFDDFLRSLKTALMFEDWIEEATEDQILVKYRVAPGEFYGRREIADWLVYSLQEIALLLGHKEILKHIRKLRVRLEYGVKEELIPLVRLKQVGRIRARKLFNAGIKSLADLRKTSFERISAVVGPNIAKIIKDQLEGKEERKKAEKQVTLKKY
jgi:helicase